MAEPFWDRDFAEDESGAWRGTVECGEAVGMGAWILGDGMKLPSVV
jgi:hypothetical protein